MLLGNLLKSAKGKYQRIDVKGISFDSRKVKVGNIFFAIKGNKTSGTQFIKEAIKKKASVIVADNKTILKDKQTPIHLVKDVRKSLSEACSNFYKDKPKNIIAVTGTNGKSSVANFFYQIMSLNKIASASIGTLGINSRSYNKKTNLTSMDPLSLHKNLERIKKKKINNVIIEASSHGLDQKRLDYLNIKTAIFTNLSHDHLDYHKNNKSYLNSKMYLFKHLIKSNSRIITDEDIKEFKLIKNISKKRKIKKITIGLNSGKIIILNNQYKKNNQILKISIDDKIFTLKIPLAGFFQIKNLLMAVLAAHNSGLSFNKIFKRIHRIKAVPGRLETVRKVNFNSNVIIDFAHTPEALETCLLAIKQQFKKNIILVFGCGGERDKKKRFKMGNIAKKYCRKVFVTDDNPRNENPKKIRLAIIKGCKNIAINIGSRKQAIYQAMKELKENEILLIAGKGHEKTQDYGGKIINFSDKLVVKYFKFKNKFNKKSIFKKINYSGVSINTRTIKKNNLFFAIKGKNADGHNFVKKALSLGAKKSIVSKRIRGISNKKIIKVKNTLSCLNDLAKITRYRSAAKIVGITGSAGKTTLKNLVSFALKNYGKVYQSPLSYNNRFGVPLSLSNLKKNIDYGVFEIGMDKKGEIYRLSRMVKPEIGVITNISEAHIKNFKSLQDIAKAKGEIIENIMNEGTIILNKDDNFYNFFSKKAKKRKLNVISFSSLKKADIFLIKVKKIKNYFKLKINVKNSIFYFYTKNSTKNFISNLLGCISILSYLNLDLKNMEKRFNNFSLPEGRGDTKLIKRFKKNFKFIDESYNANPLSMKSAINNVHFYKRKKNEKKIIFLGDMLELGKKSKRLHRALSSIINKKDIDKVYVYGKYIKETFNLLLPNKKGKIFNNLKEAYSHLDKILYNNDLLMVKGSNATGLNKFSKNIKKGLLSVI